ncbi:GDP-fucose transporter 1 [Phlebotomus argentipes]|uniref:GDP-fucose transporter 1 n=1 Tax=Phlebotomus argentipes TaxID=94469 RepID=UPI0028932807|nr:GDP-fucose transporter 1 [Phlebotomus argentipes]
MYQPLEGKVAPLKEYVHITVVVLSYWVISMVTVFINKSLLSSDFFSLDAPLFITWSQCVVSAGICFSLSRLSKVFPKGVHFPEGNPLDWTTVKSVLPLSLLFTLMISTNNLCLKYVGVAFYYVGRSLTTVFNVVFSFVLLQQKTSGRCILCCVVIIAGFWLGVDQESLTDSFSLIGTIYGVVGSLALSLYSIYTKKTLVFVNQEVWLLSYYNNVYSTVIFLPLILVAGEIPTVMSYKYLGELWFWLALGVSGVCGFAIGYVTALQIKVTSPLTHNISGTAKACVQTVIATEIYSETKSFSWWLSNIVVLKASALYAWFKQREMQVKFQEAEAAQKV